MKTRNILTLLIILLFQAVFFCNIYGQTELQPWGNITGIRVDGQLMEFESSIRVVGANWGYIASTGKERQQPKYTREGNTQVVTTRMNNLYFIERVEDAGAGIAKVTIQCTSKSDTNITGIYLCIELPGEEYTLKDARTIISSDITLPKRAKAENQFGLYPALGISFRTPRRQFVADLPQPDSFVVKKENVGQRTVIRVYLPVITGNMQNGQTVEKTFTINVSGEIDKSPIHLALNTAVTGRAFEGLGGNFRIQNTRLDPQVIDYSLNNLRLAWGRVEMPWSFWHPVKESSPGDSAIAKLNPRVLQAMQMAQRLGKLGIPVILSAWFPPAWAVQGELNMRPRNGIWGNALNKEAMNEIYKSITDYILYVKKNFGVEIKLFSFNESDLGINVRQTAQEHTDLIKGLGAYFASKGLATKMLLGDNSDANSFTFINPAMADPAALPYIGAISFHSWRGWEKQTLEKWADAATKLNLPLLVGEGSIDAAAWNYPAIFQEPVYAMAEINLYTRILAICQPASILQWQLTADYSPLAGGGIFGDKDSLRPTQRFWNLKQLASTPRGLLAMPLTCDKVDVSCAALGNNSKNLYAIHLVNNGAARQIILAGIPKKVKQFRVLITDKNRGMKEDRLVKVSNGKATFILDSQAFTTLVSD